ncbi:deoxyhypusine hydroxylase [Parasteatoda tepidariorum]|uniref:deoxyhypusine hydroxylase n=1 Tax=Parasteatoda tepidariorum TaxID=114398 RepID=UPI00077FA71B|nr:deoxyhypusine hydroxylase [Parasteatoda tepidariorum]
MQKIREDYKKIENIGDVLLNTSNPLKKRFRALFTLKNIGGPYAIEFISKGFSDSSALLKHECAYCLGQMKDPLAIPKLISVLEDLHQEPIVRHEAAEALAAIGDQICLPILNKYIHDSSKEVSQTCEIAVQKFSNSIPSNNAPQNPYKSEDPAPPLPANSYKSIEDLENIFLDSSVPLYQRYQALFTLRNLGTKEAAIAIAKGLECGSPLFRHEVAFVLGQMQNAATVEQLTKVLQNVEEHEMVRHECAEALGAIATEKCMEALITYLVDDKRVVRESCEVAVDMCEYENSVEFQYANALLET